ncbi:MAG: DNA polymerase III subunit delta' [Rudaea sp.]
MTLAPWNEDAWCNLRARRLRNALPHALLLCGAEGLGKRAFADAFASALLCPALHADGHACGECRACRLFAAGTHPDLLRVNFELRDDGKPRTEITVDQIRFLNERLSLTAQFGGGQIALIDPADAMNNSAGNALLKTLEEPAPGTVILLIADRPSRLAATIRSRCQRVEFRVPAAAVAQAWLQKNGVDDKAAQAALDASDGNPGLALAWSRSAGVPLRNEVAKDLHDLGAGLAQAWDVAQRWSRDRADLRLRFAAALAQRQGRASVQGADGPLALTAATDLPKLALWFDHANRTRDLLRGPLRPELALLELLSAWSAGQSGNGSRTERI